jgi:hypothetical protein
VPAQFGRRCCRETIRRALHRLKLSWQKAHKLLGRADPEQREAFIAQISALLDGARDERHHLVYLDEAHITRMSTSATAGASAASASRLPHPRLV